MDVTVERIVTVNRLTGEPVVPISRILLVVPCLMIGSAAIGAQRVPVVAPRPSAIAPGIQRDYSAEERENARDEFIAARAAFADVLISALTSDELIERAGEFTHQAKLKNTTKRLAEVKSRLRLVETTGGAGTDEAERLRVRASALSDELEVLSNTTPGPLGGETGKITAKVVAGRLHNEMAEETDYLADVLQINELKDRAQRLRRLVLVARIAGGVKNLRQGPKTLNEEPPTIVPTGGESERPGPQDNGSLGEESKVAPRIVE